MTESTESPARSISEWLARDELRGALRALLATPFESVRPGLPWIVDASSPPVRGPAVLVETARVPEDPARTLAVVLPSSSALGLVDRLLGGSAVAPLPLAPSAAECGVLAYAASRVLAASSAEWCLRDVRAVGQDELGQRARGHVLWPLLLAGPLPLELSLLLSRTAARELGLSFLAKLALCDHLAPGALDGLAPGEVLASDRWSLSATTDGWAGPADLLVAELGLRLPVRAERGSVRSAGPAQPAPPVALVLAEQRVDLDTLAGLGSGERLKLAPGHTARLECPAGPLEGELVLHQGAPALRITRCDSAASPAPPRG